MLKAVAEAHPIDPARPFHVTTSIGVSVYPDDGLDAETHDSKKRGHRDMYQAKENGRQSYPVFKPAMNVRAVGAANH